MAGEAVTLRCGIEGGAGVLEALLCMVGLKAT